MKRSNKALRLVYFVTLAVILLIIVNVFLVTIGKYHLRSETSLDDYLNTVSTVNETVSAKRGNIYDANGEIVAQDIDTYDIICYLSKDRLSNGKIAYVDDPLYTSQVLASILDMEQEDVYYYLTRDASLYQTELGPKGRNLSAETVNEILSYPNIHGIGFKDSSERYYPQGSAFAPYLIGFAQSDDTGKLVGKMGLEQYLNEELSGIDGKHKYQMSKDGYILPGMYEEYIEETDGYDVYTTLDSSIQQALETSFDDLVVQNNASQAWGAVVEINTGKILAWGQTPGFDPNELNVENWTNIGSQFAYEPGSVFKSIIYAAAMDMGVYSGQSTFDSSTYCYLSNGNVPYRTYDKENAYGCITNAAGKQWGDITFDYGLIYSSNVATMTLLEKYVGTKNYINYVLDFGFFSDVDTDGILETTGIKNSYYPSEKLSMTYGQGSSVTMLQLLQAYTAIFGNGEMLKPYYIDKIVDPDTNEIVYQGERTVVSTPIKESTARQMQDLLYDVVYAKGGTAQYYKIDETEIIAKTGTSEISLVGEGYNSEDSITSIMLAYPKENPQYMIYYAYISPYDYYNHLNSSVIKEFTRKTVLLTNSSYSATQAEIIEEYKKQEMPNLINESVNYATSCLTNSNVSIIKIGDGTQVIDQYPKAGSDFYTGNKVFLLTNGSNIKLPDFKGWTRKDIISYWNLSGIPIAINGYGVAYDQSILPNSIVSTSDQIIVYLKDIKQEG